MDQEEEIVHFEDDPTSEVIVCEETESDHEVDDEPAMLSPSTSNASLSSLSELEKGSRGKRSII